MIKPLKFVLKTIVVACFATFVHAAAIDDNTSAKLIAGIPSNTQTTIQETQAWKEHSKIMTAQWQALEKQRLSVMRTWRQQEIGDEIYSCDTMLYPFSGPDFLNMYILFPGCNTYVLFGLEHPGSVPPFELMNQQQLTQYFNSVRAATTDLIIRNYYITAKMDAQLNTPHLKGVTPLLLAAIASQNAYVLSVDYNTGTNVRGVVITFVNPESRIVQRLYYFSQNATNVHLKDKPQFLQFVEKDKRSFTLIKSASYLLHDPQFTMVRDSIIKSTTLLIQDDTGVPYKHIKKWDIAPYGIYQRPISAFNYGYQPDLATFYQQSTPKSLPFSFGYHWEQGQSGLVIARKNKLP